MDSGGRTLSDSTNQDPAVVLSVDLALRLSVTDRPLSCCGTSVSTLKPELLRFILTLFVNSLCFYTFTQYVLIDDVTVKCVCVFQYS